MRVITYFICTIILAMGLIACGSDGSEDSSGSRKPSGSTKKEVAGILSAEITGDLNENYLASKPMIQCSKGVFSILDMNSSKKNTFDVEMNIFKKTTFNIDIPMQLLHQGEYQLVGRNDKRGISFNKDSKFVLFSYEANENTSYGKKVKGTISFTSIPKKIGDYLRGYLNATARTETHGEGEKEINIGLQFEMLAESNTFHPCE